MKKNVFLLMGLAALLIVGLSSCSKDDDDDNGNPEPRLEAEAHRKRDGAAENGEQEPSQIFPTWE